MAVDGSGNLIREYVMYPGIDQPLSMRNSGGSTYYYSMEYPGHVNGLVNSSNAVVNTYKYSPWGEAEAGTSETVSQPLRYMARELDATTGLYYVRNRWYDPVMNRFVSEDPIGLAGGINLYRYVRNSPTNLRDPSGLDPTIEECIQMLRAWGVKLDWAESACGKRGGSLALPELVVTRLPWSFSTSRASGATANFGGGRLTTPYVPVYRPGIDPVPWEYSAPRYRCVSPDPRDRRATEFCEIYNAGRLTAGEIEFAACRDFVREQHHAIEHNRRLQQVQDAKAMSEAGIVLFETSRSVQRGSRAFAFVAVFEGSMAFGRAFGVPLVCAIAPGAYYH